MKINEQNILAGVGVLVVDDHADECEMIAIVLETFGASVTTAPTVRAALEAVEEFRPAALICDISLPDGNGYELIRAIRALGPDRGGSLRAAALTGWASPEDREHALDAGFDEHVKKPVDPDDLVALVVRMME